MNLAAAEKDTWRRHRRIIGPAFNNKAYIPSHLSDLIKIVDKHDVAMP
jgi:cytochrome P450